MAKQKILKDVLTEDIKRLLRMPNMGIEELRFYLAFNGKEWNAVWAGGHDETVLGEWNRFMSQGKTGEQFYRESETMLYHGVFFGEDQWKIPYRQLVQETMPARATILDYGCGVGSDGIKFAEMGYDVSFADYQSKCLEFLKWRIELRDWQTKVYPDFQIDSKFDLVFAFDVLEHSQTPEQVLVEMEKLGGKVAVNLLPDMQVSKGKQEQFHYAYDHNKLLEFIKSRGKIIIERNMGYAIFCMYEIEGGNQWHKSTAITRSSHLKMQTPPVEISAETETTVA